MHYIRTARNGIAFQWRRTRRALSRFARAAADVAMPPLCPSCRAMVGDLGALCAPCWSKLTFISRPYCERLGVPFGYDSGPGVLSIEAVERPPAYSRARAAVIYDDIARALVHALKYGDRVDLAPMLGRWMAQAGGELTQDADLILPVPLHWRRLWARRFNQAALLAQIVANHSRVAIACDVLHRVRATPQQVGLSRSRRAENVDRAFRLSDGAAFAVRGRKLVLVDDVLTSGATANACARALLRAGAMRVDVLVFARVVEAGRAPI